ncbi:DUF4038 domain-containing protein [Thomasclavelia ramosa]|uniref:apiosidase-like domain-containing protein n=1 Tax=Thomasclavelia ramosa TaxID=1547 RepID=UPI000E4180D9|nr:DUF4038 domain-containing protein [Thomasclavelia ramosa]RGC87873.1 DUF4038 domain-containing protein [Thomasclavelia ramosa]
MRITISENKRYFKNEKNNNFFYFADTCWSAFTNIDLDSWEYYLQYRRRQGFNVLQINILPQWDASETNLDFHPFEKDKDGFYNYFNIKPDYFQHAKEMCEMAKKYGFELALVVLWCNYVPDTWANKLMKSKPMPYDAIDNYIKQVHETFSTFFPFYIISGDTDLENETSINHYRKASHLLKELAPNCLQTYHIRGRMVEIPMEIIDEIDFYMYQTGHSSKECDKEMCYKMPEYFLKTYPIKPLINSEPCYEAIGFAGNMYGRFHQFDIRRAAWQSLLSGASAGIAYGSGGVYSWHRYGKHFSPCIGEGFDMPHPWQIALHYPGAWDYSDIKHFFHEYEITELNSKQEILLNDTQEIRVAEFKNKYFIYVPENTTIRLKININDIQTVTILDLETRHKEIGNAYQIDSICCLEMHTFAHDVLYVVELK